ncbi:MAG: hypothetical protein QM706_12140 [Nitrospira sp.]
MTATNRCCSGTLKGLGTGLSVIVFVELFGKLVDSDMKETAHYCEECIANLSPTTVKNGKEKEFWSITHFPPVSPLNYERGPHAIKGICDRCGQAAVVNFYRT